ncbi:MAG: hypothetical protein WBA89_18285 [Microcoleus sp.]|uniref:hypothetical protein n=1 Tax=Microcoleus sp. TaxID=44472 RepID=UPI003C74C1A5
MTNLTQLTVNRWLLAVVICQWAVGCWLLAVGSWLLSFVSGHLAVGYYLLFVISWF